MMTTLMTMTITNFISEDLTSPTIFSQRTRVLQLNSTLCPSHVLRLCCLLPLRGDEVTAILLHKTEALLLTNSMQQISSCKAKSSSPSQKKKKIPALYVTRKFITANETACHLSIQSQINRVHAFPFYFSKINFNIILLSTPKPLYI